MVSASTLSFPPPASEALLAGDRILMALDGGDFDAVLAAAQERGALVAALTRSGVQPTPALAEQFAAQDRTLADRLGRAYDELADALRRSTRSRHAAHQYASTTPARARLHAQG